MIFYFTGTGNSLEVAQIIAQATDDKLVDIGKAYKHKRFNFTLKQGEDLGFVFPTYSWSTPPIIDAFIRRARFTTEDGQLYMPQYCYLVLTSSSFVGNTARFFAGEFYKAMGININASFSVKTVGNHIANYAPAEGEKKNLILKKAQKQAHEVAQKIRDHQQVNEETRHPFGMLMSAITGRDEKPRSTKEFYTLSTCTHCGLCVDVCPTNTITLIDGKPRWAEMGCTLCFACLHRCPAHAIQYGKNTETRPRYINPVLFQQDS